MGALTTGLPFRLLLPEKKLGLRLTHPEFRLFTRARELGFSSGWRIAGPKPTLLTPRFSEKNFLRRARAFERQRRLREKHAATRLQSLDALPRIGRVQGRIVAAHAILAQGRR
jgi:hypothetical protein